MLQSNGKSNFEGPTIKITQNSSLCRFGYFYNEAEDKYTKKILLTKKTE